MMRKMVLRCKRTKMKMQMQEKRLPPKPTRRITTSLLLLLTVVLTLLSTSSVSAESSSTVDIHPDGHLQEQDVEEHQDEVVHYEDRSLHRTRHSQKVPDECQLVYAPRHGHVIRSEDSIGTSQRSNGSGTDNTSDASSTRPYNHVFDPSDWGVFTLVPRKKGTSVYRTYGDIVIQWPDRRRRRRQTDHDDGDDRNEQFQMTRTWNGRETGGQFEGKYRVESVVPGIAMLSSSHVAPADTRQLQQQQKQQPNTSSPTSSNILPLVPRVDEGGLTRIDSPGAGSITHYHNYTWWFTRDMQAGEEILPPSLPTSPQSSSRPTPISSFGLDELKTNGYCIDNIRPRKSHVKGAGRGAFASRDIPEGSVVAPYPLMPIHRNELLIDDDEDEEDVLDEDTTTTQTNRKYQLLLNYCLSQNITSDWVYFPYSSMVNLINHYHEPNVKLAPPPTPTTASSTNSIDVDEKRRLRQPHQHVMLELVATRPIQQGEELYLDYGRTWEDAWWNHVRHWKPYNPDDHYAPAYVIDDTVRLIRTEQEQKAYQGAEYADNVITTCFYRYSDRSEEERREAQKSNAINGSDGETAKKKDNKPSVRTFKWEMTKGLFELRNLRPCNILKRVEDSKGRSVYAVRMMNHPSLPADEQIPGGDHELHLVTHIPRIAIRFSDKAGTTDQHLPNAFRHEIGLPVDIDIGIEP